MAARVLDELVEHFAADTFKLRTYKLAAKHNTAESTVRDWRLCCKPALGLDAGCGKPIEYLLNDLG